MIGLIFRSACRIKVAPGLTISVDKPKCGTWSPEARSAREIISWVSFTVLLFVVAIGVVLGRSAEPADIFGPASAPITVHAVPANGAPAV